MNTLATPRRIRRHRRFGAGLVIAAVATVGIADATSTFAIAQDGSASHTPASTGTDSGDTSQGDNDGGLASVFPRPDSPLPTELLDLLDDILADPTTVSDLGLPQELLDRLAEEPIVGDLLGDDDADESDDDETDDDGEADDTDPGDDDTDEDDADDEAPIGDDPVPAAPVVPELPEVDDVVEALPDDEVLCPESDDDETADDETADGDTEDDADVDPLASTLGTVTDTLDAACDLTPEDEDESDEDTTEEPADEEPASPLPSLAPAPDTTPITEPVTTAVTAAVGGTQPVTEAITPAEPEPQPEPEQESDDAPLVIFEAEEALL